MKTTKLLICGALASLFFTACQKSKETGKSSDNISSQTTAVAGRRPMGACEPNAYEVGLDSRTYVNGLWEWVWSVQNPNPGNGLNGTVQNMSHWGFPLPACVPANALVSAAYSADGVNWTSFTPTIQVDPSQPCVTTPVLKFNFGTNAGNISYYKLVVNGAFDPGEVTAYYKSGSNTGCCQFSFTGISCPVVIEK